MFILKLYTEFLPGVSFAMEQKWPMWITWLGRMLWIGPMVIVPLGSCIRTQTRSVYDLVEEQYGIRFNCVHWNDHTYHKSGEKLKGLAKMPKIKSKNTEQDNENNMKI